VSSHNHSNASAGDLELLFTIAGTSLVNAPYFAQWLGLWCIESQAGQALYEQVQLITDLQKHVADYEQRTTANASYPITVKANAGSKVVQHSKQRIDQDGVALISLNGPMQKHSSSFSGGASTVLARRDIRNAANDPTVGSIMLAIESPGGTAAGTYELATEVKKAREKKPVTCHFTDIGASAAYWAGCNAQHISANQPAQVGSIGTYTVVHDMSGLAAREGIKVHVIRAGEFKGMGTPGTPITESQLAHLQEMVNGINGNFLQAVSEGRGIPMDQLLTVADGRVYPASSAKEKKLIDRVSTFDEAYSYAQELAQQNLSKTKSVKGTRMSTTESSEKVVASVKDIEGSCPGASAEFVLGCMRDSVTVEQAQKRWTTELSSINQTLNKENAELKASIVTLTKERDEAIAKATAAAAAAASSGKTEEDDLKLANARPGIAGPKAVTGDTKSGTASENYWSEVAKLQASGKSRAEAMRVVNTTNPALRSAMVAEANRQPA
jgi:signal peptide peptidase SppA